MKKQLTITLALLTLSAALAGCGSDASTEAIVTEENIVISEEATTEADEVVDADITEEVVTETPDAETAEEDAAEIKEEETKEEAKEETKVESDNKTQVESTKPSTNTSKPSATPSTPSTSKPSTDTSKPQTNTGSNSGQGSGTTTKPQTSPTPSPSPSPTPSAPAAPENNAPSLSCSAIFSKITTGVELPSQMEMDATLLNDFYGIDTSLLEDYCVKMPMMSFHITEIGVFKVKDVNNVSKIVDAINKRASNMGTALYPSLLETYESRKVVTKGQYILFAVADGVDTIVANFNSLV